MNDTPRKGDAAGRFILQVDVLDTAKGNAPLRLAIHIAHADGALFQLAAQEMAGRLFEALMDAPEATP